MSATRPIIDAVQQHLQEAIPWVQVDVFPERPADYQFIHPVGAVLVGYQSSQFMKIQGLGTIAQQRNIVLHLTIIGAHLHGDDGALAILDEVRLAIVGFVPPNCLPCHLLQERFISEDAGSWHYELTVQTETQQVQVCHEQNLPRYAQMQARHTSAPLNPDLKPKQP